jgi:hypothetical protein
MWPRTLWKEPEICIGHSVSLRWAFMPNINKIAQCMLKLWSRQIRTGAWTNRQLDALKPALTPNANVTDPQKVCGCQHSPYNQCSKCQLLAVNKLLVDHLQKTLKTNKNHLEAVGSMKPSLQYLDISNVRWLSKCLFYLFPNWFRSTSVNMSLTLWQNYIDRCSTG